MAAGTYNVTTQINFNKAGATLLGEPGAVIFTAGRDNSAVDHGCRRYSPGAYHDERCSLCREFIQIGAADVKLIGNTIYGPEQPPHVRLDSQQGGRINEWVYPMCFEGNTFYSLRTGMYISPNTTGAINNNVVYNTKGGFPVDRAFTTFSGNSWGDPPNEFDIVLLEGTTEGPPYDDLEQLSGGNNNATISDQRSGG